MKWMKELIRSIKDRDLDLQERLFRLLGSIGLCGLAAGIIYSIVIGEHFKGIIMLAIAFMFFVSVFWFSLKFHQIQLGATIVAFVIIFVLLPFTFLTSGGMYAIYLTRGIEFIKKKKNTHSFRCKKVRER